MIRIGQGYDVHAFCEGEHIMMGGARIPHSKALKAHSDGDVLLHALCDALLGAAALGDIGKFFPDNDPKYKGADSRVLLGRVMKLLRKMNISINNVDMTVVAQQPKMAPYISYMKTNIAEDLGIVEGLVSVKATTTEWLGFTGREEGIAAYATVLVTQNEIQQ
jgi:2-C-methyl-D-erythritol 2,4-cyclodiphosphate synthase